MLEDIINEGILEMARSPFGTVDGLIPWSGMLSVRVLVVLCVVAFLLFAPDIIFIFPFIFDCVTRSKASASLEHSISTARVRDEVAVLMSVPFCLIADRFELYSPSFMDAVRPDLTVFCVMGVMLAYLLVRSFCFVVFRPLRQSAESLSTIRHIPYNFFIALVAVMLVTVAALGVFHVQDSLIKTVLLWETALFYLLSVYNIFHFLSLKCNIVATFLYLCALEFLPTGLLIASEFVL